MPTDNNKKLDSLAQAYGFKGGSGQYSKSNQGQNSQINWFGADNWEVKLGDGRAQKGKGFSSLHQFMSASQQPVLPGSGPPGGEPGPVKAHYDFEEMLDTIRDGTGVSEFVDSLVDDDLEEAGLRPPWQKLKAAKSVEEDGYPVLKPLGTKDPTDRFASKIEFARSSEDWPKGWKRSKKNIDRGMPKLPSQKK